MHAPIMVLAGTQDDLAVVYDDPTAVLAYAETGSRQALMAVSEADCRRYDVEVTAIHAGTTGHEPRTPREVIRDRLRLLAKVDEGPVTERTFPGSRVDA